MSGHNKWAQIKHQKAITDAKKSKIFSKLVRVITVEAKKSGGNLESPGLRSAILRAKAANMPAENIERAVKKALGDESAQMEALTYEAYGPGGVALMIDVLTDNRNKSAQEVKHILSKHHAALAEQGAAAWAFTRSNGVWTATTTTPLSEEDLSLLLSLAEDLEELDDVQEVTTNAE